MLTAMGCDHIRTDTPTRPHTQPELANLLDEAHPGDLIIACRLDRLAPNLNRLVTCVNDIDRRGLHLRLIEEGLDSSDPLAPPLMPVLNALADFQHRQIQERTHAGLATARAKGRVGGRPPVMDQPKRQRALQLHNSGATTAMIAAALEVSRATIYRFLAEAGDLTPNQLLIPDHKASDPDRP